MKRYAWKLALGLLALAAAVSAYSWLQSTPKEAEEKKAALIQVQIARPRRGGLERLCTRPATVQSWEFVDLFGEVTGVLAHQNVDINSEVKRGQVLATIYAPDLVKDRDLAQAALSQARDKVAIAAAYLDTTRARLRAVKAMVLRRKAELPAATAYLVFRKIELKRYTQLVVTDRSMDPRLVAEERDRHSAAQFRKAEAVLAIEEAEDDVKVKEAEVKQEEAALKVAQADVDVAQAGLDKAQVFVDFTEIKAPFHGIITFRSLNNSAFIRAKEQGSQIPLLTLKRTDLFRIVTYVPETDVPYVRIGDPVTLTIPILGRDFPGKVARRALSQHQNSRLMRTEVDMENTAGLLRDGMYGDITIHIGDVVKVNPYVVNIPSDSLQDEGQSKERIVYTLRPSGTGGYRVHVAPVLIGYNQDKGKLNNKSVKREDLRVEVLRGLTPNDPVVKGQVAGLTEGALVAVKE